MDKLQVRSEIYCRFVKNLSVKAIKADMDAEFGKLAPSSNCIRFWVNEFNRGRETVYDEKRSGRPKATTAEEKSAKVLEIVFDDSQVKVREIIDITKITKEDVLKILQDDVSMKKLFGRWVPRKLSTEQKYERFCLAKCFIELYKKNSNDFFERFVTVGNFWIHRPIAKKSKSKKEEKDLEAGASKPKKRKTNSVTTEKVLGTFFWDSNGIILSDYLSTKKKLTEDYYVSLLSKLSEIIIKKRSHLSEEKILYYHGNETAHLSAAATAKLIDLNVELLPNTSHIPDLNPSDFYIFTDLKNWLKDKRFGSKTEISSEINLYFANKNKEYYKNGIEKLQEKCKKCVELEGDYVE